MSMKTLLMFAFLIAGIEVKAQSKIEIEKGSIQITVPDSVSVQSAFKLLDNLVPLNNKWYDRYVVIGNSLYYSAGMSLFRKAKIYKIVNGKFLHLVNNRKPSTVKRG